MTVTRWEYRVQLIGDLQSHSHVQAALKEIELNIMRQALPLKRAEDDPEPDIGSLGYLLNRFGDDGWELVTLIPTDRNSIAVFKRPLM